MEPTITRTDHNALGFLGIIIVRRGRQRFARGAGGKGGYK
jgi:hypothetical protein